MMLLPQGGSRKFGVDPSTVRVRPATAAWTPAWSTLTLRRCVAARAPNEPSPRRRSVARVGLAVHVPPLPRVRDEGSVGDRRGAAFGLVPVAAVGGAVMSGFHSAGGGPEPPVVPGGEVVPARFLGQLVIDHRAGPG